MGLETEYAVRYTPRSRERPLKKTVFEFVASVLVERLGGSPVRERFYLGNGGVVSLETPLNETENCGLLEMATPECAGPAQLLLYQAAQDQLLREALPLAQERLKQTWHYHGSLGLIKNCRDAQGEVYGVQENYEAIAGKGVSLWLRRLLLLPLTVPIVVYYAVCRSLQYSLEALSRLFKLDDTREEALFESLRTVMFRLYPTVWYPVLLLLQLTCFVEARRALTAFLVSRTIFIGSGTLNSDGTFEISERAAGIDNVFSWTPSGKPFYMVVNLVEGAADVLMGEREVGGLMSAVARLQLGCSEANMCERAEYLKLATTCLVLDMIESGELSDAPRVADPVKAIKTVSKDLTLGTKLQLEDGTEMTAVELQRWYLGRARAFVEGASTVSLEAKELLKLWEKTLDQLESDPAELFGCLDWVTKKLLLSRFQDRPLAARKKLDLKYHELVGGYHGTLVRAGLAERLLSQEQIRLAMESPPRDTPALARVKALKELAGTQARFSWESALVGSGRDRKVLRFRRRE